MPTCETGWHLFPLSAANGSEWQDAAFRRLDDIRQDKQQQLGRLGRHLDRSRIVDTVVQHAFQWQRMAFDQAFARENAAEKVDVNQAPLVRIAAIVVRDPRRSGFAPENSWLEPKTRQNALRLGQRPAPHIQVEVSFTG